MRERNGRSVCLARELLFLDGRLLRSIMIHALLGRLMLLLGLILRTVQASVLVNCVCQLKTWYSYKGLLLVRLLKVKDNLIIIQIATHCGCNDSLYIICLTIDSWM